MNNRYEYLYRAMQKTAALNKRAAFLEKLHGYLTKQAEDTGFGDPNRDLKPDKPQWYYPSMGSGVGGTMLSAEERSRLQQRMRQAAADAESNRLGLTDMGFKLNPGDTVTGSTPQIMPITPNTPQHAPKTMPIKSSPDPKWPYNSMPSTSPADAKPQLLPKPTPAPEPKQPVVPNVANNAYKMLANPIGQAAGYTWSRKNRNQ